MADQNTTKQQKPVLHPGSSEADAKAIGGSGDFGIAEKDVVGRTYTSRNTKQADRGVTQERSGETEDSDRTSGAGGTNSGPGSSSGGDLDTDLLGLGTGGGVAASGKVNDVPGPDDSTGTSRDFASGPPAKAAKASPKAGKVEGSTVQLTDANSNDAQGADAAPNAEDGSDAAAGEVSNDEASGRNDAGD
jgi:hypothetical protein